MKKRLWFAIVLIVSAITILSACGSSESGSSSDVEASNDSDSEILTIGEVDSLTGPAAVYGVPQNQAIEMAVDEINEAGGIEVGDKTYKLDLATYDDQGDASEAVSAVRSLIDRDGVQFIVGWASSTPTIGAAEMIGSEDALMIVGNAGAQSITTQGYDNVFRVRSPGGANGAAAGEYLANQGYKDVAVISQLEDSYYINVYEGFKPKFTENGGNIVAEETFHLGDRDMYTQLTSIVNLEPDAIYAPGYVEQVAFVIRQAREQGYEGPIYSEAGGSEEEYLQVASNEQMENVKEIRIIGATEQALGENGKKFVENYRERYDETPNTAAIYGYDTVYALKAGLEKAGSLETDDVISAMNEMAPPEDIACLYLPVDGKMFDDNGQGYVTNVVIEWNDGEWNYIEEAPMDAEEYSEQMKTLIEN